MPRIQKFFNLFWLPITALVMLAFLYGSLTILDLKNQNENFRQKQILLEVKITQLEKDFGNLVQIAGTKEEATPPKATPQAKKILALTTPVPTPLPTPLSSSSPTSTPSLTPKPTSSPTPTNTPTPTPTPTPIAQATVIIGNVGSFKVDSKEEDTAFSILLRAGQDNGFTVEYQIYEGLGVFITCIASICGHDSYYWAFYYNGGYSMVGASSQSVNSGDITEWKFESF